MNFLLFLLFNAFLSTAQNQPLVLVCILARNAAPLLHYFLGQFEELDYPKDRLRLYIRTDYNTDGTADILLKWTDGVQNMYESIDFLPDSNSNEKGQFDETLERQRNIINLKEEALVKARNSQVHYIFFLDMDAFLTNDKVLRQLISAQKVIVAPMLLYLNDERSNFRIIQHETVQSESVEMKCADKKGPNKMNELKTINVNYSNVFNQDLIGCFAASELHSAILIDLQNEQSHKLTFCPDYEPQGHHVGESQTTDMMLVHSAQMANVQLHILNTQSFGYILKPLEPDLPLEDLNTKMNIFLLELMMENIHLLHSSFTSPTYPKMDRLGFDQIYFINLAKRPERIHHMTELFHLLGINATRWLAVDGERITDNYICEHKISMLPGYIDPFHQRILTKGEVGLFLTAMSIWQDMIDKSYDKIMVFEDDIVFESYFRSQLNSVMSDINMTGLDWDLIYLGHSEIDANESLVEGHRFLFNVTYCYGTYGYLLSRSGARKLLGGKPLENLVPLDEYFSIMFDQNPNKQWKSYFPERNLIAYSTFPLLVYPSHYIGDPGHISDTEKSTLINGTFVKSKDEL